MYIVFILIFPQQGHGKNIYNGKSINIIKTEYIQITMGWIHNFSNEEISSTWKLTYGFKFK